MYILDVCDNGDLLSVLRIVNIVITIIKIIVPIILIVSVMLTYTAAVKSNDNDAISKASKNAIAKVVAAIIIFFIPTFVNTIADVIDPNSKMYISCLDEATVERIQILYKEVAGKELDNFRNTLSLSNYQTAKSAINKMDDGKDKEELKKELEEYYYYAKLKEKINSLRVKYSKEAYEELSAEIGKISDPEIKNELLDLLERTGKGKSLNIKSGPRNDSYGGMNYYEVVPPNPTTNLPLVVYLHGDYEGDDFSQISKGPFSRMAKDGSGYQGSEYFYIAPHAPGRDWISDGVQNKLMDLINYKIKEYSIDTRKVIITGMSRGAIGTWEIVNRYPSFFSAAITVSCCPKTATAANFRHTPVYALSGNVGADEAGYSSCMSNFVNQINGIGGKAIYKLHSGYSHTNIANAAYDSSLMKWALSK